MAVQRLRTFIYRFTLAADVSEDILQETMTEMLKILGKLQNPDRFWPWLYGIAVNKVHRHHRTERRKKTVPTSDVTHKNLITDNLETLDNLVTKELKQIVPIAMSRTEFGVRKMFFRAKKSLKKELSKKGFNKTYLLSALGLFGKLTTPAEATGIAATAVTAASIKTGFVSAVIGTVTTKAGMLAASAIITAGLTVGTVAAVKHYSQDAVAPVSESVITNISTAEKKGDELKIEDKQKRRWYDKLVL